MSNTVDQDCTSPLHWGEIPYQRSNLPLLWHLEAVSEQGCLITTNGVLGHKGAGNDGRGCNHGDE